MRRWRRSCGILKLRAHSGPILSSLETSSRSGPVADGASSRAVEQRKKMLGEVDDAQRQEFFRKIKPYVQAWYDTWHESMLDQPFYRVNSRT
jgi:hypothetical protein